MTAKISNTNKKVIPAANFFSMLKTKQDFRSWLADKITGYEMEEGEDYFIFLSADAAAEVLKHESCVTSGDIQSLFK
ncbi:Phage anti-repressor protein [Bacteroidales bacterium Barb6]|nr:Phage anti-repressor protein [Bacteroidales bacterium Barb4]OAV72601.1 Phage anti-repressor protein [Bacteroidales bacterium Barb6]